MNTDASKTLEQIYLENRQMIDEMKKSLTKLKALQANNQNSLKAFIYKHCESGLQNLLKEAEADENEIIDLMPLPNLEAQ